jgi:hypothetical protein
MVFTLVSVFGRDKKYKAMSCSNRKDIAFSIKKGEKNSGQAAFIDDINKAA